MLKTQKLRVKQSQFLNLFSKIKTKKYLKQQRYKISSKIKVRKNFDFGTIIFPS